MANKTKIDEDVNKALESNHREWLREQSESFPTKSDEGLREKIAHVEFCKQNCNALFPNCGETVERRKGCKVVFLQERKQNGWPFKIADAILKILKDNNLTEGKKS